MQWNINFATGIKSIDEEHHEIVKMITKLQDSLDDGLVTHQLGMVLKDLVNYTKYHFSSEENFMSQIHFPGLEIHIKFHKELTENIIKILLNLKEGKTITSIDLIEFLKNWLTNHIINEDKKIGIYYTEYLEKAKQ